MATLNTTGLHLPADTAEGMIRKAQDGSVVAQLSNSEPFRFGDTDFVVVNDVPRAEFVGESQEKSLSNVGFGTARAKPRKAQTTLRFSSEVMWADEDHQKGILNELATAAAESLPRALDLGVLHAINPLTGLALSGAPAKVVDSTNAVTAAGAADLEVEAALAYHLDAANGFPSGIAMDPRFAFQLATLRDDRGNRRYPDLPLNPRQLGSFSGLISAVSDTVAAPEAADEDHQKVRAIIGDWSRGVRWGVARNLPVEVIRYGDPDGSGDLQRKNEIALRVEVAWVWYVDPTRFTVISVA